MCGITGFVSESEESESHHVSLETMVTAIAHRGPDSSGTWVSPERTVWLGHARLAIQDISPAGHQPIVSPSGNLVLTYNGEIYNHRAIREELKSEDRHQSKRPQGRDSKGCGGGHHTHGEPLAGRHGLGQFLQQLPLLS